MKIDNDVILKIEETVNKIRPILANNDPGTVGAVLAELLAMLCAGMITQDPDFIDEMLKEHMHLVKKLVPVERAHLLKRLTPEERKKVDMVLDNTPRPGYLHS